ncbi:hypothetical protein O9G_000531 [Rozella allomycis CSF55]|uniref:Uncharacterized protein n=1 Tax=Rozella allomycis (strain CSF55) TaxID=988480 RepID=A0A075B059_ROZAC|nr:hypothetical protein O9G_000531 [Rozella allomycis CSF55]|eukprot:EPZ34344.1 hypothetical protein O9G_000531 [Rozella allomycis CSF55]
MTSPSKLVIVMKKVSMRSNEKKIKTFARKFAEFEDQEVEFQKFNTTARLWFKVKNLISIIKDRDEEFIRSLADKLDGKKFGDKIINVVVDENSTHFKGNGNKEKKKNKNVKKKVEKHVDETKKGMDQTLDKECIQSPEVKNEVSHENTTNENK